MALVIGPGETHGQLGAQPRAMVIALIEAMFGLRFPAGADPSMGPVTLNHIDESTGCYWLGDDYTLDVSPYDSSPDKSALYKTSFLPTADLAMMWKTAGGTMLPASITIEDGVCTNCYPAPPDEPPLTTAPLAPCLSGDGGAMPPPDDAGGGATGDDAAAGGYADSGSAGDDASVVAPPQEDATTGSPPVDAGGGSASSGTTGNAATPSPRAGASAGCSAGGRSRAGGGSIALLAIGVAALRLRGGRRRQGGSGP
jgi:hypothetical protein